MGRLSRWQKVTTRYSKDIIEKAPGDVKKETGDRKRDFKLSPLALKMETSSQQAGSRGGKGAKACLEPPEGTQTCGHFALRTSDPQNWEGMHLC